MRRRERAFPSKVGTRSLFTALGLLAMSLLVAGGAWVALSPSSETRADSGTTGSRAPMVFYVVRCMGPNDGEPINGRLLRVRIATNCTEAAKITVAINGSYFTSMPLQQGLVRDKATNLYLRDVDADIVQADKQVGQKLLLPDAGPLTVTYSLYSNGGTFLAEDEWKGYFGKPWIEFLWRFQGDAGAMDPARALLGRESENANLLPRQPGQHLALLHIMSRDMYYFLMASPNRSILERSPDDVRLHREAKLVLSGHFAVGTAALARTVANLDPLFSPGSPPIYVVLWTLDEQSGWRRSVISPVGQ